MEDAVFTIVIEIVGRRARDKGAYRIATFYKDAFYLSQAFPYLEVSHGPFSL